MEMTKYICKYCGKTTRSYTTRFIIAKCCGDNPKCGFKMQEKQRENDNN